MVHPCLFISLVLNGRWALHCAHRTASTLTKKQQLPYHRRRDETALILTKQSSQTNTDLMHSTKLTGNYQISRSHRRGVSSANRLHVILKTPGGENLSDIISNDGLRSPVASPWRRSTLGHINLVSSCPYISSLALTRKQIAPKKNDDAQD